MFVSSRTTPVGGAISTIFTKNSTKHHHITFPTTVEKGKKIPHIENNVGKNIAF